MRWATVLAVVVHAAAFAFSPTWSVEPGGQTPSDFDGRQLVLLGAIEGPPVLAEPPAPPASILPAPVEDDPPPDVSGDSGGTDGDAGMDPEAVLRERLGRRGPLVPALATVAARPTAQRVPNEDADPSDIEEPDPEIDAEETSPELTLPEPDSLSLERLSAVRPELALMSTSAWVLIRNQTEVEAYLRRSYTEGRLDRSAEGSVSVTLWIDHEGSVEWAEITESSGRSDLDEFALALFNEVADFRAARERGERVSRSVTFSLNFPW